MMRKHIGTSLLFLVGLSLYSMSQTWVIVGNTSVCPGDQNVSYSVQSSTGGMPPSGSFSWKLNGAQIQGSIGSTNTVDFPVSGTSFVLTATGSMGASGISASLNISMDSSDPGIIALSSGICNGGNITITASSYSGNVLWQKKVGSGNWTNYGLGFSSSLSESELIPGTQYQYRVRTNGICSVQYSNTLTVTPRNPVNAGNVGASQIICFNTSPSTLTAAAPIGGVGSYSYSWEKRVGQNWQQVGTNVSFNPGPLTETTEYRRTVTDAECGSDVSNNSLIVIVDPLSVGGTLSGSTEEFGIASGILSLNGQVGDIIEWQYKTTGSWMSIAHTGSIYNYSNIQEPTYFRARVRSGTCNIENSSQAFINIIEEPEITLGITSIRPGYSTNISVDQGHSNYEWFKDGISIPNVGSNQLTVSSPGKYKVKVTSGSAVFVTGEAVIRSQLEEDQNSVVSYVFKREGYGDNTDVFQLDKDSVSVSSTIYDGLGRPIQDIQLGASPLDNDLIIPIQYDEFGRIIKQYLPYVETDKTSVFRSNALRATYSNSDHYNFYVNSSDHNSPYAFSETEFESSPLNRPVKQGAPGADWQIDGATEAFVKYDYQINDANEVFLWDNTDFSNLKATFYEEGELYKNSVTDEDQNTTITFTDKQGKTILKRSHLNNSTWADTYYIYDIYDQLKVVIQPQAIEQANQDLNEANSGDFTFLVENYTITQADANKKFAYLPNVTVTIPPNVNLQAGFELKAINAALSQQTVNDFTFQYEYDGHGRMISKQVPGADSVHMVYDQWDRLVLTQDGEQRRSNQWLFTSYDALNRPVITGKLTRAQTREQIQSHLETKTIGASIRYLTFTSGAANHEYNQNSYPFANADSAVIDEILTVTYYDDYNWDNSTVAYTNQITPNSVVKGQVTGSKTRYGNSYIKSATYYDDKYRPIQTQSTNHLGGVDIVTNYFDFIGQVDKTITSHFDGLNTTTIITRRFEYDHAGRLLETYHEIDNEGEELIAFNQYNELGELVEKNLHSDSPLQGGSGGVFAQTLNYTYNIRGWLTSINDADLTGTTDLFGLNLHYNSNSIDPSNVSFNGNISAMKWSNNDTDGGTAISTRAYNYSYDALNRLTNADHIENSNNANFDVSGFEYDLNGNIKRLVRKGDAGANMDNLTYTYEGNQLLTVADSGNDEGFNDGNTSGDDYLYDKNGNMTVDKNKGITGIEFNHLNLPVKVEFDTSGDSIIYLYDAAGIKLKQTVYEGGNPVKTTDYVGEFIYENDTLQLIQFEEGRIIYKEYDKVWDYQYHLKDHLGNVRVTFSTTPENYRPSVSYEDIDLAEDSEYFGNVDLNRVSHPATTNSGKATRLNNATPAGTFAVINVNKGDTVHLSVKGYYEGGTGYSNSISDISVLENSWNNAFTNSNVIEGSGIDPSQVSGLVSLLSLFSNGGSDDNSVPGAYLNYIYFDEEMNVILTDEGQPWVGFKQITSAASFNEETIDIDTIIAESEGRIIAYISYESDRTDYVHFDDFTVYHGKTNIVSTDDYYPFGLTFNSYSRTASTPQNYKYNGKELQEETQWLDYGARMYQPEIGKFFVLDRYAEKYMNLNPYQYAANNPISNIDINGDSIITVNIQDQTGFIHGQTRVYIDHTELENFIQILNLAAGTETHLHINSSFRTNKRQEELNNEDSEAITPAPPGNSPHNAGVALDFNVYNDNDPSKGLMGQNANLTDNNPFIDALKNDKWSPNWRWGGDFNDPDRIHIDNRPDEITFAAMRDANQQQMNGNVESSVNETYISRIENVNIGGTTRSENRLGRIGLRSAWRGLKKALKNN